MASILCNNCNYGIHYHDIPEGIEFLYIPIKTWEKICQSRFDKNNPIYDEQHIYPKLFRSDTIEADFKNEVTYAWKCPSCESILVFHENGSVKNTYIKSQLQGVQEWNYEGLVFDDYTWHKLVEKQLSNNKLQIITPTFYVRGNETELLVSADNKFEKLIAYYRIK